MEESRLRAKKTTEERYGADYWQKIRPKEGGFSNPDTLKKALETRRKNRAKVQTDGGD